MDSVLSVKLCVDNWTLAAQSEVLPVRCKNTSAQFHKSKFGSGNRGKCILSAEGRWLTPQEFEAACGRGSSKDWKRSIRFGGRSMQALVERNIIAPHSASCGCANCCEDEAAAAGPVRYFVPYKRRRRRCCDEDEGCKCKEKAWRDLASDIDDGADVLQQLDRLADKCSALFQQLQECVNEAFQLARRLSANRCANCNREARAECSLCRATVYCSAFCQKRDWNAHQLQCVRAQDHIMVVCEQ